MRYMCECVFIFSAPVSQHSFEPITINKLMNALLYKQTNKQTNKQINK